MKDTGKHIDDLERVFRDGLLDKQHPLLEGAADRALNKWKTDTGRAAGGKSLSVLSKIKQSIFLQTLIFSVALVAAIAVYAYFNPYENKQQDTVPSPAVSADSSLFKADKIPAGKDSSPVDDADLDNADRPETPEAPVEKKLSVPASIKNKLDSVINHSGRKRHEDTATAMNPVADSLAETADSSYEVNAAGTEKFRERKSSHDLIKAMMEQQKADKDTGIKLFEND